MKTNESLMPTEIPTKRNAHASRSVFGTFFLHGSEFAIEMIDLQEVVNAPDKLQKMPLAPPYLQGLFNLRGQVLPVIDLHILLKTGAAESEAKSINRMVILRRGAASIGILFEEIGEVLRVGQNDVIQVEQRSVDNLMPKMPVKAVLCLNKGERVIQVLDLSALLAIKNLPALERSAGGEDSKQFHAARMRDLYREKLIGFTVGEYRLALEMKCISSIVETTGKQPSPYRLELCESMVMVLGKMVPVVQMSDVLHVTRGSAAGRILICRVGEASVGFEVDEVTSIIPYAKEKVLPIPILEDYRSSIFHGCFTDRDGKDYIVLNEEGTLSAPAIREVLSSHQKLCDRQIAGQKKAIAQHTTMLTFSMGRTYGLRLADVLEVLACPAELIHAPDMPADVLGVLNLRGVPVSVVDPRRLFGLEPAKDLSDAKLLVFEHEKRKIAMRVDSIESILSVPSSQDDRLPTIFFREDISVLGDAFERGVQAVPDDSKTTVVILSADQIVKKLSSVLTA